MVFSNNLLMGAAGQASGYEIDQSIRFNDGDSAYLTRTPGSAGNQRTWTWSAWLKRCALTLGGTSHQTLFSCATENTQLRFHASNDTFDVIFGGTTDGHLVTSQVFRDVAAFYSIVVAVDTTQAVAADRCKVYVNGLQVTDFGTETYPAQNYDSGINNTEAHNIGRSAADGDRYFDGYMADIFMVDGTALDATSFGETNDDGVWIPKAYSGAYGTNGFFIDGRDSSDLGDDESGNGNDFTSSGLATTDQMLDTPTLNASTFNPLWAGAGLSDGNLVATATGNTYQWATSTFAIDDGGKYVCEFQKSAGTFGYVGIFQIGNHTATTGNNYMYAINVGTGEVVKNASVLVDVGAAPANSLMRIEYDGSNDTIKIFDDGAETFPASTGVSNTVGLTGQNSLHFGCAPYGSGTVITATFQGLSGTPTADFLELTSANLATPSITDGSAYFQPTLYTGTGSSQAVSQAGNSTFQPDWVWIKGRSGATEHVLTDAVRGVTKELSSNDNGAEETVAQGLTTFGTAGFTVGTDGSYNTSSATYVGWQWKANGSGSSNEDGATTSTVSASATSGFSIVKWTGTGANTTLGHGLGVAPQMILVKNLADADSWVVYHEDVGATKGLTLDTTAAPATASTFFNNTAPTSSVFSVGSGGRTNGSSDAMIAYCFAEVEGYSSFGDYTGNGSADGAFIYTGFKPAYVLMKKTSAVDYWIVYDSARDPDNFVNKRIYVNTSGAEDPHATNDHVDLLSNGFKQRSAGTRLNASGGSYIYMAFAENPFGGDGAAPATAR